MMNNEDFKLNGLNGLRIKFSWAPTMSHFQ
jgi:hypothetical protein